MAQEKLPDPDTPPAIAPGHDVAALGPGDTSDSGSDVAGLAGLASFDPAVPVDVALDEDRGRPGTSVEAVSPGSDTDAAGTGERRSVADDAEPQEAADILPDRIVDRNGKVLQDGRSLGPDALVDRRGEDAAEAGEA